MAATWSEQGSSLYTEFGGAGMTEDLGGGHTVQVADLFINTNPQTDATFDTAVRMRAAGQGNVYTGLSAANVSTSIDKMAGAGSNWIFGGRYNPSNPTAVPVEVKDSVTPVNVGHPMISNLDPGLIFSDGFESLPSHNIWYQVEIDLTNNLQESTLGPIVLILWATGTCANDTAEGQGPPPRCRPPLRRRPCSVSGLCPAA